MKLLEEITAFPSDVRHTLESEYGIETAEAFYAHAAQNPSGLRSALHLEQTELDRLADIVEGFLPLDYIERCHGSVSKHPHGAIFHR